MLVEFKYGIHAARLSAAAARVYYLLSTVYFPAQRRLRFNSAIVHGARIRIADGVGVCCMSSI